MSSRLEQRRGNHEATEAVTSGLIVEHEEINIGNTVSRGAEVRDLIFFLLKINKLREFCFKFSIDILFRTNDKKMACQFFFKFK